MKEPMTPKQKRVIEIISVAISITIILLLLMYLLGLIADNM